jgi:hypothetical protein
MVGRAACPCLLMISVPICLALSAAPTLAGDIPDAWRADIAITLDLPPQSVTGIDSSSAHADGTVPFSVASGSVDGKADVPYQQNNSIAGCSGTLNGTWHMSLTGDVQNASAGEGGVSLNLTDTVTSDDMVMAVHCNDQTIQMPMALPLPTLQFKLPVKDQVVQNIVSDSGPARVNGSVKFNAPCEGWDFTTDERGPKVTFQPADPNSFPTPETMASTELDTAGVSNRFASLQQGNMVQSSDPVALGLTEVPSALQANWPIEVKTGQTTPRGSNPSCVFVESITVTVPYDKIRMFVSSDLGPPGEGQSACRKFVADHENDHYQHAWQMMRSIARDIKAKADTYPGPNTARPADGVIEQLYTPTLIENVIRAIISNYYTNLAAQTAADDAYAAGKVREMCP